VTSLTNLFDSLTLSHTTLSAPDSRIMFDSTIYTRAYSISSAGQLVSAKGLKGDPLSDAALIYEFRNHSNVWNREPTALVSVSSRIVDTLKRAFKKHFEDGESPEDIWVAFIEVPNTINGIRTRHHAASVLAEKCKLSEPNKFYHEVVFEWTIPEKYVTHKVSLQNLMDRGIQRQYFPQSSTAGVRCSIAQDVQHAMSLDGPWEIGVRLGCFARNFGARAPLNWISHQLFHDCVRTEIVDADVVRLHYAHGDSEVVDFKFFCDLEDGIKTALYDWWLSDIDFHLDNEEFEEWRDAKEDSMTSDLIEFWETWHNVNCDGTIAEIPEREKMLYNKVQSQIAVKHDSTRAALEAEAVRIGL
jgi:hypothetical protein